MFKIYQSETQVGMYLIIEVAPPARAWIVSNVHSVELGREYCIEARAMGNLLGVEPTYREALAYIRMSLLMEDL
ncbi:hypothetical protein NVP1152O_084 [Vibrio phage 1.152.O._10N.222.46.E1]|uniref:Uncharacterized protein n=5 Tax=Nahantvirus 49C7 TaxID=2846601 RepID=A0A2I7RBF3_9CAUD|nr:hypothetical protein HYP57_gp102 [Vibrio phage 1.026.O._10N.222.49.C7]AUR82566.1 hypothetical protein NVP1025O_083 [Vibrio phage 1.025.O._10N.222.46.B6]AUR90816.1 hypothetical protein NVP1150O_083 [Vibrio phage 1.150.O._10N.222.46.A6]AUR90989.1 hypothetical protein NVP1152O_084 [Vibrio phage 1.152.O._10N.222.46.E1]AUS02457.1 hypothetical protein NVP2130O_083 [Vibrio phage 2.130.O._10N.222.46.C2]AUR82674.1 hypothetical protein NVP1026O_083 [Vibrio phage 1.026.O._10N.222.49.C7]